MFLGYGIIAVPTGIVTTHMTMGVKQKKEPEKVCAACGREGHDADAVYCKWCSARL